MTTVTQAQPRPLALETSLAMRIGLGVALSAVSGLFLFLAFPPFNWWPLIWVALVPYLLAQHRLMPLKLASLAPAIAAGVWLWPFLYRLFNIPGAPLWFVHLGLAVGVICYFLHSERKFCEQTGYRWFILQGVFYWVGFEMIRSFIPFMGTMGFAANPLASQAWLIQPVSIFSIYGMSLMVLLFNFAVAQVALYLFDRNWKLEDSVAVDGRATWRWMAGIATLLVAWVALSLVMYNQSSKNAQTVRVAALQSGYPQVAFDPSGPSWEERLGTLSEQVREAAAQGARVIFTPELAFDFDPQVEHTDELRALAAETGAYLYLNYGFGDDVSFHNETVLLSPSGEFSEVYGKFHPSVGERQSATAGNFPVHETPFGRLASVICMDGLFTDATRYLAQNGAQLIAIPTANTTVGISEQNWTHFVFRSVETQTPVVNADYAYVSMITDSRGRILEWVNTPDSGRAVLVTDVTLGSANSPHRFLGDWLGWVSLAGFALFIVFETLTNRRAKRQM
jgi:apolipoprotein N-acyltransferase